MAVAYGPDREWVESTVEIWPVAPEPGGHCSRLENPSLVAERKCVQVTQNHDQAKVVDNSSLLHRHLKEKVPPHTNSVDDS